MKKYITTVLLCVFAALGCEKEPTPEPSTNGSNNSNNNNGTNTAPPTKTLPNTTFISTKEYTLPSAGAWWTQDFTISASTTFVFRAASRYNATFAVMLSNQASAFQNGGAFSYKAIFDSQIGTQYITLPAGSYTVGARNNASGANVMSLELDNDITLPESDKASFVDKYLSVVNYLNQNGGWLYQEFSIQDGYRYFTDGCNSGNIEYWIIPASELNNFTSGNSFEYFQEFNNTSGEEPGLHEITLPVGAYYYVFKNTGSYKEALTFTTERWNVD